MSERYDVFLKDLHTGTYIEAELNSRIDAKFAIRADNAWLPYLANVQMSVAGSDIQNQPFGHAHWIWEEKVKQTSHMLSYPTMGIEYDGQVQGLMLLQTDGIFGRLPEQKNAPLVYVYFLAAAPWNVSGVTQKPRFSGVGTNLIRAAIETSIDLGFKGRIGLHSLKQAEKWYDHLGMACLGPDSEKGAMKYYEMTAAQAAAFLS